VDCTFPLRIPGIYISAIWNNYTAASHVCISALSKKIHNMAEQIQQPDSGHGKRVRRTKILSTKVDLTPMVDLGFLLITFFILTKTLSEPKHMQLLLPAGNTSTTPYGESTVLTVIPLGDDKVFYYHGNPDDAIQDKLFGIINPAGIRNIIMQKQLALEANPRYTRKDLMLIIKPIESTIYKNIVVMLDEVLINDLKHYSLVDISPDEKKWLGEMALLH
jgi:biopolymer transport protein ExbD